MNKITVVNPPKIFGDKSLLNDEMCYYIEPYDDKQIISAYIFKDNDGYVIKLFDDCCKEIKLENSGPIGDTLMGVLNICLYSQIKESQFFFAVDPKECILVDVYDTKSFISAGMIKDLFGKRIKTQNIIETKRFSNGIENYIIKPVIMKYHENNPLYLKV